MTNAKVKLAGGAAALLAALGAGGAIAADKLSPSEESDAVVADAAKQLGISADKLDAALKQALENRVDAAVSAGTITAEQGAALKERIAAGEVPLVGLGRGPGFGHHHGFRGADLDAAASYLGLTEDELHTRLENGDTLAEIAKAEGKTADGLVNALVAEEKKELADAVADGRLTDAQRDQIVSGLQSRIEDFVNNAAPQGGFRHDRDGDGDSAFAPSTTLPPAA
jgi:hypothetical protein